MATFNNLNIARYLNDSENPLPNLLTGTHRTSFPCISPVPRQYANRTYNIPTRSITSQESASTVSPSSEYDESVFSRQSYKSTTTATSHQSAQTNPVIGWPFPTPLIPHMNTAIVLPCEFVSISCGLTFHPDEFENWLEHTLSHFSNLPPPSKCLCLFCDEDFEDNNDPRHNWRQRMAHSREHLLDGETNIRPDFLVLDYMWKNGLMTNEDYALAEQYTERPAVPGLVRKGFETPEEKLKREKESKVLHNLQKEERDRKRSSNTHKGKERQTSTSSRQHQPVFIKHPERT
ncbi:hypothetical protein MFRU_008g00430 [Monilinia fructicola]|uniref:Uncharacterized protein n=2 Tax=Monilinia fructicola TaxID=38448 RepID=A0A5M9JA05_MONFR|nr:hypothetical protein EYC84_010922 [Monilinia fructicola]KAG4031678.1 hypothetical protein MFRU_008g00430 [Monilinia fructicola]